MAKIKDPLRALDGVVTLLLFLYAAAGVAIVLGLVLNGPPTSDDGPACVTVSGNLFDELSDPSALGEQLELGADDFAMLEQVEVCDEDASTRSLVASDLHLVAGPLSLLLVLVPVRSLLRRARRGRLFSVEVARRTTLLGIWVMVAWLFGVLVRDISAGVVLAEATDRLSWSDVLTSGPGESPLPFTEILVAAGLITTGRVMAWGVLLQNERDTTI